MGTVETEKKRGSTKYKMSVNSTRGMENLGGLWRQSVEREEKGE